MPVLCRPQLRLFLPTGPFDEAGDGFVSQQLLDRVEMPAQIFFARDQFVDGSMTVAAQINGLLHLLPRVPLLEPLVAMASPRNQMMLRRPLARSPLAEFAMSSILIHTSLVQESRWTT